MSKIKILVVCLGLLSLAACSKATQAHKRFVEMCKEDPRAQEQGFDCDCQADIIAAVLKESEMDDLIHFIDVEKQDHNKALELGKDPKYTPMFQKIAGIGLAIHDKCGKRENMSAPTAPAASAPAEPAPTESSAPSAPESSKPSEAPPAAQEEGKILVFAWFSAILSPWQPARLLTAKSLNFQPWRKNGGMKKASSNRCTR